MLVAIKGRRGKTKQCDLMVDAGKRGSEFKRLFR
jgi:hypothetical protein